MHYVERVGDCADLLRRGIANRITSATVMNSHSSRSHAIFTVWVKVQYTDPSGNRHVKKAKLNLVDLAGSERHGKTGKNENCILRHREADCVASHYLKMDLVSALLFSPCQSRHQQ